MKKDDMTPYLTETLSMMYDSGEFQLLYKIKKREGKRMRFCFSDASPGFCRMKERKRYVTSLS